MSASSTPLPATHYAGDLHVDASYGPVVRLTAVNLNDPDSDVLTQEFVYVLFRIHFFILIFFLKILFF